MNESAIELLSRMQGLLKVTVKPPYYESLFSFKKDVREKINEIQIKEKINQPIK